MVISRQPEPGTTLPGGYHLLDVVGEGMFARVYEARAPGGERVAVKMLHRKDEQSLRRFLREIKVLRQLPDNPNCVKYVDHGDTLEGQPWVAMEFVDGFTLGDALPPGKRLSEQAGVAFMHQLCMGFAGLHKLGLAHRDIKPDNIMITRGTKQVKLMDFGLVQDSQGLLKLFEEHDIVDGSDFADDLDQGFIAGTPEYMAPEQISDPRVAKERQKTDTTADVFSLGVIFYQLLTGRKLFPFEPSTRKNARVFNRELLDYLERRADQADTEIERPDKIKPELWTILRKALHRDPKLRYFDATKLAGDLEVYLMTGSGVPDDEDKAPTVRGLPGLSEMVANREKLRGGITHDSTPGALLTSAHEELGDPGRAVARRPPDGGSGPIVLRDLGGPKPLEPPPPRSLVPWIVSGASLVVILAVVLMLALGVI